MKLVRGLHNLSSFPNGCVATIGNFDGVHKGHQIIIEQLQDTAHRLGLPAVVMVFEPQPREYFDYKSAPPRLMRFIEKLTVLRSLQVDCLVCLQFNHRLRSLTAQQFVEDILINKLKIKHLVVGDDFRFGCDRAGDFKLLEEYGQRCQFTVNHTPTLQVSGHRVSSTRVREVLSSCDFDEAETLLGRPYQISGRVIHGRKLGRQLNVPTANILIGHNKPVLSGVYLVSVNVNRKVYQGVANIGVKPTLNESTKVPLLEVHLLNFDGNIYGQRMTVTFIKKVRDEQKFSDIKALQQQIKADIAEADVFFQTA